jgi:UTP-glucose-1-phosphate uridylyltransferase
MVETTVIAALERVRDDQAGGELQLTDGLAAAPDLAVIEFTGQIYDCGTPSSYLEAAARWYASSAAE